MLNIYKRIKAKLTHWISYEPENADILPYDFTRMCQQIKPGDVLLVEGRSRISTIIRTITQSPWTHAALYIGRLIDIEDDELVNKIKHYHPEVEDKSQLIVESLLDRGTVITPLSEYGQHHLRICRPIGLIPDDNDLVIRFMINALGQAYNVRHILDLARFLLPWSILPRRWGSSLFRTSSGQADSGICTSLIAEAYYAVQFPILPFVKQDKEEGSYEIFHRNPYLFSPKDFDYSPYFEIIKYPLFNPEEPLPYYRRMPWTKRGLMHQDHGILSGSHPKDKTKS